MEHSVNSRARCEWCNKIMEDGEGCEGAPAYSFATDTPHFYEAFDRIQYGKETRFFEPGDEELKHWFWTKDVCRDCGVAPGQLHHPGCGIEECPQCHGQAISCNCPAYEEEELD